LRNARDIADELTAKGVTLSLGESRHDPTDPIGRPLFNVLGMVAEFERDLISMRTREGMAVARAKGRLEGQAAEAVEDSALPSLRCRSSTSIHGPSEARGRLPGPRRT